MYDPLDNMLEQVHASRIYIAVVYSVILVIFGLVCLFRPFRPNGIWSLIQTRLGVKEDGPPSRRARLAVRVIGVVCFALAAFMLNAAF